MLLISEVPLYYSCHGHSPRCAMRLGIRAPRFARILEIVPRLARELEMVYAPRLARELEAFLQMPLGGGGNSEKKVSMIKASQLHPRDPTR